MWCTTTPFISALLFILMAVSGLLLGMPIELAAMAAFAWILVAAYVFQCFSQKNGSSALIRTFHSSRGIGIILGSFACAVAIVFFIIHAFDYLSPDDTSIPFMSESAVAIQFLIGLWTIGISYATSDILARKAAHQQDISKQLAPVLDQPFSSLHHKMLPDLSLLEDGRAYDIAKLGLFDGKYALPHFYIQEIKQLAQDSPDDTMRQRARKAVETLKKLETLAPSVFQTIDTKAPHHDDISLGLTDLLAQFAHQHHSKVITLEPLLYKADTDQSTHVLSLDAISAAIRSTLPKGEYLNLKIQRLGKEPKQGIGYLDDGTMVVVNGGGDYLGKTVRAQFLSQKYSSSGKIVFCNAIPMMDDDMASFTGPQTQGLGVPGGVNGHTGIPRYSATSINPSYHTNDLLP